MDNSKIPEDYPPRFVISLRHSSSESGAPESPHLVVQGLDEETYTFKITDGKPLRLLNSWF